MLWQTENTQIWIQTSNSLESSSQTFQTCWILFRSHYVYRIINLKTSKVKYYISLGYRCVAVPFQDPCVPPTALLLLGTLHGRLQSVSLRVSRLIIANHRGWSSISVCLWPWVSTATLACQNNGVTRRAPNWLHVGSFIPVRFSLKEQAKTLWVQKQMDKSRESFSCLRIL